MIVWVLLADWGYDGETLEAVFTTEAAARAYAATQVTETRWHDWSLYAVCVDDPDGKPQEMPKP